ncbi:hypothetical protein GPECTOR_4g751 [Gonium pectorale]|uniref:Apple domain-containing protein n=1 Tax=Gonium pectorale TaxID=33097 RepID=A0A150GY18_GONPE|nr:hypothetical protein GPECTOR_4g751 [Gonium pectorale]|eukprot:KXZ54684.1 hypothetical protein GPECTOR_4g751 [Gonium pectorale]
MATLSNHSCPAAAGYTLYAGKDIARFDIASVSSVADAATKCNANPSCNSFNWNLALGLGYTKTVVYSAAQAASYADICFYAKGCSDIAGFTLYTDIDIPGSDIVKVTTTASAAAAQCLANSACKSVLWAPIFSPPYGFTKSIGYSANASKAYKVCCSDIAGFTLYTDIDIPGSDIVKVTTTASAAAAQCLANSACKSVLWAPIFSPPYGFTKSIGYSANASKAYKGLCFYEKTVANVTLVSKSYLASYTNVAIELDASGKPTQAAVMAFVESLKANITNTWGVNASNINITSLIINGVDVTSMVTTTTTGRRRSLFLGYAIPTRPNDYFIDFDELSVIGGTLNYNGFNFGPGFQLFGTQGFSNTPASTSIIPDDSHDIDTQNPVVLGVPDDGCITVPAGFTGIDMWVNFACDSGKCVAGATPACHVCDVKGDGSVNNVIRAYNVENCPLDAATGDARIVADWTYSRTPAGIIGVSTAAAITAAAITAAAITAAAITAATVNSPAKPAPAVSTAVPTAAAKPAAAVSTAVPSPANPAPAGSTARRDALLLMDWYCQCNKWSISIGPKTCIALDICRAVPCGGAPNKCIRDATKSLGFYCQCGDGFTEKVVNGITRCYGNVARGAIAYGNSVLNNWYPNLAIDGKRNTFFGSNNNDGRYPGQLGLDLRVPHYIDGFKIVLRQDMCAGHIGMMLQVNNEPSRSWVSYGGTVWTQVTTFLYDRPNKDLGPADGKPATFTPVTGRWVNLTNQNPSWVNNVVFIAELELYGYSMGDANNLVSLPWCSYKPCGGGTCNPSTSIGYWCKCWDYHYKINQGTLLETCVKIPECNAPSVQAECAAKGMVCINLPGNYTCGNAPPASPPPPLPPGLAQVTANYEAGFSNVALTIDGQVSDAAVAAFVNDFKTRVAATWKIPFNKVVIKSITINGVTKSLQRRRAAAESADSAATSSDEIIEIQDSLRHPLRALQDMGLTHIVQVGQPQVTTSELLHEHHTMEAYLLGLHGVHHADLRNLASTHRVLAGGDAASMDFSVTKELSKPPKAPKAPPPPKAPKASPPPKAPLPPAAPPPPGPILWAVSATASAGHNDASASNAVGAPKKALTKRTECRPAKPTEAWIPAVSRGERFIEAGFDGKAPSGSQVASVALYLLNSGTLANPVTAVTVNLQLAGQAQARTFTVFTANTTALNLACPGITYFPVAAASLRPALTARQYSGATVVSARISFNETAVGKPTMLPQVIGVGLAAAAAAA